ncbi:hypothetical protein QT971_07730 [Microcoleus sp. herbarium19]|uniref:hypothetical protein n=1 Tax=unclassified Microcoleus TaxID=2642155 RepID=UPI002FD5CDA4
MKSQRTRKLDRICCDARSPQRKTETAENSRLQGFDSRAPLLDRCIRSATPHTLNSETLEPLGSGHLQSLRSKVAIGDPHPEIQ